MNENTEKARGTTMNSQERIGRVARQHLQTSMFLGVDFVPVRMEIIQRADDRVEDVDADGDGVTATDLSAPATTDAKPQAGRGAPVAHSGDLTGKARALAELRERHDRSCPHCSNATDHTQSVFGEGNPDAAVMFIGEAPGEEEDRTGRPFVGRAGQKLTQIIESMGLKREDVYIANVLKSRPPNNRTPLKHEVDGCGPFLADQIRIIQPQVIVTLGGPATKLLLDTEIGITRLRGQWSEYVDVTTGLAIPVMPTFHPAYLLRNYTVEIRKQVWADMQAVVQRLGSAE
jgi:uracil-DNA glycosylase